MERSLAFVIRMRGLPVLLRFALAGLLVGVAFAIRSLFDLPGHVFIFFIPPVLLAATCLDWGGGIFATVLAAGVVKVYWLDPIQIGAEQEAETQFALGAFLLIGIFISVLLELYFQLLLRLQQKSARLTAALAQSTELTRQNQVLVLEANHRIRNHLQIMAAILNLQSRHSSMTSEEAFQWAQEQIQSMARVQGALEFKDATSMVSLRQFLTGLCDDLHHTIAQPHEIGLRCRSDDLRVTFKVASTIGLLVSEMVTKAVKYALHEQVTGTLDVDFRVEGDNCILDIRDVGIGFDAELAIGVGQWLIETLARQLGGTVTGLDPEGASMRVTLPRTILEKVAASSAQA